jgi:hypothetical protein
MTTLMISPEEEQLDQAYEGVKNRLTMNRNLKIVSGSQADDALYAFYQGMFNPVLGFGQAMEVARREYKNISWASGPMTTLALHFWQAGQEARRA